MITAHTDRRPPDDGIIDTTGIRLVLDEHRLDIAARLTSREMYEAISLAMGRGLASPQIGIALGLSERQVDRVRKGLRALPGIVERLAALSTAEYEAEVVAYLRSRTRDVVTRLALTDGRVIRRTLLGVRVALAGIPGEMAEVLDRYPGSEHADRRRWLWDHLRVRQAFFTSFESLVRARQRELGIEPYPDIEDWMQANAPQSVSRSA
jgi:hypothetical protein